MIQWCSQKYVFAIYGLITKIYDLFFRISSKWPFFNFSIRQSQLLTFWGGRSIDFTDYSYNGDNIYYYWDFGSGASPQFSNEKNPSVTYNEKGTHDVTLTVCSGPIDNNDSFCREITREDYMYILDDVMVGDSGIKQN